MQIEYLREFLVLEKTRNFSEAAKLLHISQSALSKHIAALEDEVDVDLFKRLGNTLQLTEAGAVFLDGALIMVNDHNSFIARMKAIKVRTDAVLEIGYLPTVANFLIGPLYEWFSRHAPEVHPRVRSMGIAEIKSSLESSMLNYAITLDVVETSERHTAYPIYDEEFFLVMPPSHHLASRSDIRRGELGSEVFLIPGTEMPVLTRKLDNALGMLTSYCNGTIYKDVGAVLDLVSAGRGIAIAGGHNKMTHPHLLFKRLSDLPEPITVPVSLVWRTDLQNFRSTSKHIAMLKKAIDDISATSDFIELAHF